MPNKRKPRYQDWLFDKGNHPDLSWQEWFLGRSQPALGDPLERAYRINQASYRAAGKPKPPRYYYGNKVAEDVAATAMEIDGTDLTDHIEAESDEAIARAQSVMFSPSPVVKRVSAPASGRKTVKRHKTKGNMSGLDPVTVQTYSPVTLSMPSMGPSLRSAFAQFKQWFDGHRTLQNSFSFIMQSDVGKRGTLLIPLRTDAVIYGAPTADQGTKDAYYPFCAGADYDPDTPAGTSQLDNVKVQQENAARHYKHVVGDLIRTGTNASTICEPWTKTNNPPAVYTSNDRIASASNLLVPGMTQLHLECASWQLNNMKVITQKPVRVADDVTGSDKVPLDNVRPLAVLGQWDVQKYPNTDKTTPSVPNNYVSRRSNGARQQNWLDVVTLDPVGDATSTGHSPIEEQYEVQVGKGYIEFTIKNEGPRQAVCEFVLFKPNANAFGQGGFPAGSFGTTGRNEDPKLVENAWSWLKTCNGNVYHQKALDSYSKSLQTSVGDTISYDAPQASDIITNPYVNFLPESSFKNIVDNQYNKVLHNVPPLAGTDTEISVQAVNLVNQNQDELAGAGAGEINSGTTVTQGRYKNPYTHLGRAFATVPSMGKRIVRIPLPKMRYNPSQSSHYSKLADDYKVQSQAGAGDAVRVTPCIMNPQSVMIAMSLNGARSDYFEDRADGTTMFRGQDFTESMVYVDAVYRETVYPAAMVDCDNGYSFNFGRPYRTNVGTSNAPDLYAGVIQNISRVVPTAPPGANPSIMKPATGTV